MEPPSLKIPPAIVSWRAKGIWTPGATASLADFAAARHSLFDGPFTWPVMVARQSAIQHNIATLAAFCSRSGIEFAPHGKTSMAPSLFDAQLRAGAWGITVATASQVLVCRKLGVPSVLLANELLDAEALRWIHGEVQRGFEFLCYADSVPGVEIMSEALAPGAGKPLRILVELGHADGRTGCRTTEQLIEVARAVDAAPGLELAGVAGWEGLLGLDDVPGYLDAIRTATQAIAELLGDEVIVSAGGSAFFDLVAERLGGDWLPGRRLRTILRSGAYIAHDHGLYADLTPFNRVEGSLDGALEVWAQVLSAPEPGLAIAGMGKRDAPYDAGFPVPLRVRPHKESKPARGIGFRSAEGLRVTKMNDQHAYLEGDGIAPGDLVGFGISHPCLAFDKWQFIPVVDDDYRVTDIIRTYF